MVPERDFKQRSRTAFDHQASDYDSAACGRHAHRLQADVLTAVEAFAFAAVLDVGCGTGAVLQAILSAHPGVRGVGIDLSLEMLGVAAEKLGGTAELHVGDAEHLPLTDESVDLVVCVDSLHHFPDPRAALREMVRVTRPAGDLVIGEWRVTAPLRQLMNALLPRMPGGDVRIYTGQELSELAASAGFSVQRCKPAGVRGQLLVARR